MFVFLVGQWETPCPMGLKDGFILHRELPSSLWVLRMTERHLICYLVPTKEVLHHLVLLCFQVRSLLCCGMKGHTRQQCLALRNGNFCSFSWLSEHLASPPARWSDTLTCLLLPPPLTWLADTPYLLAPFFHYLCSFFFAVPWLAHLHLLQQLKLDNSLQQSPLWHCYLGKRRPKGSADDWWIPISDLCKQEVKGISPCPRAELQSVSGLDVESASCKLSLTLPGVWIPSFSCAEFKFQLSVEWSLWKDSGIKCLFHKAARQQTVN